MPQLLEVRNASTFYSNDLLKVGINNKDIVMKRNQRVRASLVESVKKTRQTDSSPIKVQNDRKSAINSKENNYHLARASYGMPDTVHPLFTKVAMGRGIFDSGLRTPIQCEEDPSSLSSSQDNSQASLSLLDYA